MVGVLYFLLVVLLGYTVVRFFLGQIQPFLTIVLSFLTGVLLGTWITFLGSLVFSRTTNPLIYGNIIFFIVSSVLVFILWTKISPNFRLPKLSLGHVVFWILIFGFLVFLMYHSFSYDSAEGVFHVAGKSWSDFASHMATLRSFSLGQNIPPESPLYAGEFFRYHFLLWFFVANLEYLGIPLYHALNLFTIFSMMAVLFGIYALAKMISKREVVAILAVLLFLLNGSVALYHLVDLNNLFVGTWQNITQHIGTNEFLSSGLSFRGEEWGMYSLNIYTNQRHFPFAMAVFASLILLFLGKTKGETFALRDMRKNIRNSISFNFLFFSSPKEFFSKYKFYIFLGLLMGLMPFAGGMTFLSLALVFTMFFILSKNKEGLLVSGIIALILALPQMYFLRDPSGIYPKFAPGYTFQPTFENFLVFLGIIFGAKLLFFLLGITASQNKWRVLALVTLPLFVLPFLIQFSQEQIHGHKFFNIWLVLAYPFIALGVVYLVQKAKYILLQIFIIVISLGALAGTGFLDTIAIGKDPQMTFSEKSDSLFRFVVSETPKDAIFLTAEYWHSPIVYAGRKLLLGSGYIPWSFGYDATERIAEIEQMFTATDQNTFCQLAKKFNINYAVLDENTKYGLDNKAFFDEHFSLMFERQNPKQFVYAIHNCYKYVE